MWNFEIDKVADTVLKQCDMFNCSVEVAWKDYMHPTITEQFELEDVKEYLKNKK